MKYPKILVALLIGLASALSFTLFGCTESSNFDLPAAYVRSTNADEQTADLMSFLGEGINFSGIRFNGVDIDRPEDLLEVFSFSPDASDWYPLRGTAPTSALASNPVVGEAAELMINMSRMTLEGVAQPTRAQSLSGTIDYTNEDGFNWTGTYALTDASDASKMLYKATFNITGTRGVEKVTLGFTGWVNATMGGTREADVSGSAKLDGKFSLRCNLMVGQGMKAIPKLTTPLYAELGGKVSASADLMAMPASTKNAPGPVVDNFEASIKLNAKVQIAQDPVLQAELVFTATDGSYGINGLSGTLTITGRQMLKAEDGYWVNLTEDVTLTADENDLVLTGAIDATASDGFICTFDMSTGDGEVLNAAGEVVASLTFDDGIIYVDFVNESYEDLELPLFGI